MATLVDKYFSKQDLEAIARAVGEAERKTSGELAIQIASYSKNWLLERVLLAVGVSVISTLVALYFSREHNWGYYYDFTQGALWGIVGFLGAYFLLWPLFKNPSRRRKIVWHRAIELFMKLEPTKGQTGVLIFVSLEEKQAAVVADTAIANKVAPDYWHRPQSMIMDGIRRHAHCEGIITAIDEIGVQLATHFPRQADDTNELPNKPTILDR